MAGLWTIYRLELRLLLRGWGIWVVAALALFFGVYEASMVREVAFDAWEQLTNATFFVTLILALTTGDQIVRDRGRRVADVLLSTPISTRAYVWGKYLAALVVLLEGAAMMLPGAILMDHFGWRNPPAILGHSHYPPLGPWTYISSWLWLAVVPVVFGAALALACVTLARGQRVVNSLLAIFLWLGPGILFSASSLSGGWPSLFDVSGMSLYASVIDMFPMTSALRNIAYTGQAPTPDLAAQMVQVITAHMPPELPAAFVWNRALFVILAVLLLQLAVRHVRARRRGA